MARASSPTFGSVLRHHRRAAGLTQEELAERASLSVRGISDLEREVRLQPHRDTVELLAAALELDAEEHAAFERTARGARYRAGPLTDSGAAPDETGAMLSPEVRTFLIADVRGYTHFTVQRGDEAAHRLAARFAAVAREGVEASGGRVIELQGDQALAVFSSARQALRAAIDLQRRFEMATQDDPDLPLPAGIGLDSGEVIPFEGGYRGGALNLAARLCAIAAPGEIFASEGVIHLAGKMGDIEYTERGHTTLKGFDDPIRVIAISSRLPSGGAPSLLPSPQNSRSPDPLWSGSGPGVRGTLPIGGFLGSLPTGTFVAREQELETMLSAIETVLAGSGRLIFLTGEPGAGKTRLAQEVTLRLHDEGFLVATGRCSEHQGTIPYYPFLEVLATVYQSAPAALRVEAEARWPYLAPLLPDDLPTVQASPTDPQGDQQRVFRAATRFLVAVAVERPVALLLDDLHWADGATLDLLQHLAHQTRGSRVFLAGIYRDVEVTRRHPLQAASRDLGRDGLLDRVAVRRFDRAGTSLLIATRLGEAEVSDELVDLVHAHAEGNAFFTHEIVRALVERGDVFVRNDVWELRTGLDLKVPESVRPVIDDRVSRLPEAAQALLAEASVLGQTFTFDELVATSGSGQEDMEAALDAATRAELLNEGDGERYAFSHALVQQALYADLSGRRKRRLHRAAGMALEALPERQRKRESAELAWHFREGDDVERALYWTLLAGDQAEAAFAHVEAEGYYLTALRLAQDSEDQRAEAEARDKLGTALHGCGRFDEAIQELEQAVALYECLADLEGMGRVTAHIAAAYAHSGRPDEGLSRARSVLPTIENGPPCAALVDLYGALGAILFIVGEHDEGLAVARRAVAMAEGLDDKHALASGTAQLGLALLSKWQRDEGRQVLEEAIVLAENADDISALGSALNNAAWAYEVNGDIARSMVLYRRGREIAEREGNLAHATLIVSSLARAAYLRGEWTTARAYVEEGVEMAKAVDDQRLVAYPLLSRATLCLAEGDWDAAEHDLQEALAVALSNRDRQATTSSQRLLAEIDLFRRQPELAREHLADLGVTDAWETELDDAHLNVKVTLARIFRDLGNYDVARSIAVAAVSKARQAGESLIVPEALIILGTVAVHNGEWTEAERAFTEALALAQRFSYPFAEAQAMHAWGMMHLQKGETADASTRLSEALAIFRRLGARWHEQDTERRLADLAV